MRKFLLLVMLLLVGACSAKKRSHAKLFDEMVATYETLDPPSKTSGKSVVVKFGAYVNSFQLDTENQELTLDAYIRHTWYDPRLKFPDDEESEMIGFDGSMAKQIWLPDTFFRKGLKKHLDDVEALVRIYKDGRVWFAQKVTVTIKCPMNLGRFPFDTQTCPLMVESFKYTSDHVVLKFLDDRSPLAFDETAGPAGFKIDRDEGVTLINCTLVYSTGTYPCLSIHLRFIREYGARMFAPSAVILIFIYLSTWMDRKIWLLRTLVMIVSTILLGFNMVTSTLLLDHPKASHLTAGDLWYLLIIIFLLIAILEFALVARLSNNADGGGFARLTNQADESPNTDSKYVTWANKFEWIFRLVFLVIILIFFAAYFGLYMS